MDVTWIVEYITEFTGTTLFIIPDNGVVTSVGLKGTKGDSSGWVIITLGYGFGVMIPVSMPDNVSSNHINPAFTLVLIASGLLDWSYVPQYIITQLLGVMFDQLLVVMTHKPYYLKTENPNAVLDSPSTISAIDDGTKGSHKAAWINGFLNGLLGSSIPLLGAMVLTKNYFSVELVAKLADYGYNTTAAVSQVALYTASSLVVVHLEFDFLVMTLVASPGGPTDPNLNPTCDPGPRTVYALLPKSILDEHKGDSKWWYSWAPVTAPILTDTAAVASFKLLYL